MGEQTTNTILEVLTKEIRSLKIDIWLRDKKISDLEAEIETLKKGDKENG